MKTENTIQCTRCLLDSSIEEITFDEQGVCSFCHGYDELSRQFPLNDEGKQQLDRIIAQIKADGKGKKYDCILGLSGGTDSSYTLILMKQLGIRPLAVHFDNGWNTEISVRNIKNLLEKLNIDLYTYVVNWEEFKDLQLSFLKASVPEVEVPTDMGIRSILYRIAAEQGLKYIIEATSFRTEGVLPLSWGYKDAKYIRSVQKIFGTKKLETYPNMSLTRYIYYTFFRRIKLVRFLNYFDYSKTEAKQVLKDEIGWVDYGGHHFESHYTRFFQSYLAPVKFNMDRRKVTLSAQVNSGQISREEAMRVYATPSLTKEAIEEDKAYITKKFKLSLPEFENIINAPARSFKDFPSYYPLIKRLKGIIRWAAKRKLLPGFFQSGNFK